MQKLVAIVPYIGTEKYAFTIVLNKTPNNATIPITVTFYDVVGNYYEQRLFIDRATFMITTTKVTTIIQERILTKVETTTQTVSMTEIITSTITGSEVLPFHMIVIPLAIIPIILSLAIYLLVRKKSP
jgi:carbohydrate-binding DOMON domain-containing protein